MYHTDQTILFCCTQETEKIYRLNLIAITMVALGLHFGGRHYHKTVYLFNFKELFWEKQIIENSIDIFFLERGMALYVANKNTSY